MTYRIGSGQGYYGDDVLRALPMIEGGHVDVVCFEALAELTLAILQKDKLNDPTRGYTFDIGIIASKILPAAYARKIPLISNGGGLNPAGAAQLVYETAQKLGLHGLKIAYVTGDDLSARLEDLLDAGETLENLDTGEPFDPTAYRVANANVYMGAQPIAEALQAGTDIVITGRVADPCLYLAAAAAHYNWAWDDWDKLASGIIAGHLLECTAQVVGGNSLAVIDQIDAGDLNRLGYPIAEVEADGSFVLTNTPGMAGIVTTDTVKEQLLYEVHDPANYITPDVIADFTTLHLTQVGQNRVRVAGVEGKPRPEELKLNLGQMEGYMRELIFTLGYPQTRQKFEQLQTMIERTCDPLPIQRINYDFLGINSLYGDLADLPDDPLELIVRVMFTAEDERTLKDAVRTLLSNGLSGPAGMSVSGTSISGKTRMVLGLFPTRIKREHIAPELSYFVVE
ncbi:MAG: acyclic terpene utilization AtuA family protein [Anaerolineae bacterium]